MLGLCVALSCRHITSTFHKLKTAFNGGFYSPTNWNPFVAAIMLGRPEPTKERVEPTILSIIAIEITLLTRFTLLLLPRIQRYMWRNHVAT